jgi:streptomycin 6-kinase
VTASSAYFRKWALEADGAPFETPSSHLQYVRRGGVPAVLKIVKPESDEQRSAEILLHWGPPAARILAHEADALLIERALPGTTLAELFLAGKDDEATAIWCDTVQALHSKPAPEGWPDVKQRGRSFHRNIHHPLLPHDLLAQASAEYFDLCATQSQEQFLLHADLNHFNILKSETRDWVVIDPKGFAGEREWEAGTFLRNPIPHWDAVADPRTIVRRTKILCDRLGLNRDRVLRWCATQAVLSAVWSAEGHGDDDKLRGALSVATAARTILG